MSRLKFLLFAGVVVIAGFCAVKNGSGQDSKSVSKTARELKKKEWLRERKAARTKDSALRAHMKHQTKDVRKRLKKDARKAKKYNNTGEY